MKDVPRLRQSILFERIKRLELVFRGGLRDTEVVQIDDLDSLRRK